MVARGNVGKAEELLNNKERWERLQGKEVSPALNGGL